MIFTKKSDRYAESDCGRYVIYKLTRHDVPVAYQAVLIARGDRGGEQLALEYFEHDDQPSRVKAYTAAVAACETHARVAS